jgi:hypothetical protein
MGYVMGGKNDGIAFPLHKLHLPLITNLNSPPWIHFTPPTGIAIIKEHVCLSWFLATFGTFSPKLREIFFA